jgi:hypothetical protein
VNIQKNHSAFDNGPFRIETSGPHLGGGIFKRCFNTTNIMKGV